MQKCKCKKEMMVVNQKEELYYCQYCGRLLDGGSIDFPGDAWFEPIPSAVFPARLKEMIENEQKEEV